jgi:glycosyltransferase involved in cell wall biosynthesis
MAMKRPTLSVVMTNYNHARFLAAAIEGLVCQSWPPEELLILDDASTDQSLAVLQPFLERYPCIRLIRHAENQGGIAAHQRLFEEARGDYLYAGAADDVRLPGFFEQAMGMAEKFPEAGVVFGMMRMIDQDGRNLGIGEASRWTKPLFADPQRFLNEYLLVERPSQSPCSAAIYRRDALLEVGGYRSELGSWSDTFAFRAIGLKYGVCYVPAEFAHFRILVGSFSQHTAAEPRRTLDVIARAERLMCAEPFRDRFPADYVRQWRRAYRWQVIRDYFLGPEVPGRPRPHFWLRNMRRLPRVPRTMSLFFYRGNTS